MPLIGWREERRATKRRLGHIDRDNWVCIMTSYGNPKQGLRKRKLERHASHYVFGRYASLWKLLLIELEELSNKMTSVPTIQLYSSQVQSSLFSPPSSSAECCTLAW